jgi:hypothetical protein
MSISTADARHLQDLARDWAYARRELASHDFDKSKTWDPVIVQRLASAEAALARFVMELE